MTEAEWSNCADPFLLLQFLQGKVTTRQLRLIAVACCRRVGALLDDNFGPRSLEVAEQCADGLISLDELFNLSVEWDFSTNYELHQAHARKQILECEAVGAAMWAAGLTMGWLDWEQAYNVTNSAAIAVGIQGLGRRCDDFSYGEQEELLKAAEPFTLPEKSAQAAVVRDIVGSPFREVVIAQSWKTMEVMETANTLYNERSFALLPVLADALESAGCNCDYLLAHCRSSNQHVRGCWVIDLVLGKG